MRFDHIFDYCIFTKTTIIIRFSEIVSFPCIVVDVCDRNFIAVLADKMENDQIQKELKSQNISALIDYHNQVIVFKTELISYTFSRDDGIKFCFLKPIDLSLLDRRPAPRIRINATKRNKLKLDVWNDGRKTIPLLSSKSIYDVSVNSISFWATMDESLHTISINKSVFVTIKFRNVIVFAETGKIKSIGTKSENGILQNQKRLVVISFAFLNKSSSEKIIDRKHERKTLDLKFLTYFDFEHPLFTGQIVFGYVTDISEEGIQFCNKQLDFPVIPGMIIPKLKIQLPYQPVISSCVVVKYSRLNNDLNGKYCTSGAEFISKNSIRTETILKTVQYFNFQGRLSAPVPNENDCLCNTNLKGSMLADTMWGERTFNEIKLESYTSNEISFLCDRKYGLLLSGDVIKRLIIYKGKSRVATMTGCVHHITVGDDLTVNQYIVHMKVGVKTIHKQIGSQARRNQERSLMVHNEDRAYVSMNNPLNDGMELYGHIYDLSTSGLSFIIQENCALPPLGTVIKHCNIQLPFLERFTINIVLSYCHIQEGSISNSKLVGARFVSLTRKQKSIICAALRKTLNANLSGCNSQDYKQLWEFYFDTEFLYAEKRKQISSYSEKVFDTWRKLFIPRNPIAEFIFYKENGEIKGHATALHFYNSAWIIQHLNALKISNGSAAEIVMDAVANFLTFTNVKKGIGRRYLIAYFRVNNVFPSIIFHGVKDFFSDPLISGIWRWDFCLPNIENYIPTEKPSHISIEYIDSMPDKLHILENLLLRSNRGLQLRIEGLETETICKLKISDNYNKLKLYRYRTVISAFNHVTGGYCFAVCDLASPGLNFSELTNSFKLYFTHQNVTENYKLAITIIDPVLTIYKKTGMDLPVLLSRQNEPIPEPMQKIKEYDSWYLDTDQVHLFGKACREVMGDMRNRIRKFQKENVSN